MALPRPGPLTAALLALGGVLAAGCGQSRPAPDPARRVVVASYDGMGAELARHWIDERVATDPDGLRAMADTGLVARRLLPVAPTVTAVDHAALVTGRSPAANGVVGNRFHLPGTPITESVSGFDAPITAETLWQAARRQGVRVGVLLWPGCDGTAPGRRADFGVVWPATPLAAAAPLDLEPARSEPAELPSADGTSGREWRLSVELPGAEPARLEWELAAVDGTPDGVPRFDAVAVRPVGGNTWQRPDEQGWLALAAAVRATNDDRARRFGSWCKVLRLDPDTGAVRLYRGALYRLMAYPDRLAQRLESVAGFWPGPPDTEALETWWLDPAQGLDLDSYLEQLERLERYLDRLATEVVASEPFRLVLAYHPSPDEYEHAGLIVDERQWLYTPGRAQAARAALDRVGRSVDRSVGDLWRALDPGHDALLVVSDHGQLPVHDDVNLNAALAAAGLVQLEADPPRIAQHSPMAAVGMGGCAHLYLNLKGREPGGVVDPTEAPELLRRAAHALADLEADGEPAVERILNRRQAAPLGLDSPLSGDLLVFLAPGFRAGSALTGLAVAPSRTSGEHGYLPRHRAVCASFFARGVGVKREERGEMAATEVRGLVDALLGLEWR